MSVVAYVTPSPANKCDKIKKAKIFKRVQFRSKAYKDLPRDRNSAFPWAEKAGLEPLIWILKGNQASLFGE